MKVKYEDRLKQKVIAITTDMLVVGVDIAKTTSGQGSLTSGA